MKRIQLLIVALFAMTLGIQAQTDNKIYDVVEQNPSYPGGDTEMYKFIATNMKDVSKKTGWVTVGFVVEKNGSLTKVRILRNNSDEAAEKEALRVVKKMPKWKPGKQGGKVVRVNYAIRIKIIAEQYENHKIHINTIDEHHFQPLHNHSRKAAIFSEGDPDEWAQRNFRMPKGLKLKSDIWLFVNFYVNEKGEISYLEKIDMNPDNFGDIPKKLEAEADRLVKIMPKWRSNGSDGILAGFYIKVKATE